MAPRDDTPPPDSQNTERAASGRPLGAGTTTFAVAGPRLLDMGYAPLPIKPGTKRPDLPRWTSVPIDAATIAAWARRFPDHGVGLRTGVLIGVDIDVLDPDLAHQVAALIKARLGPAPMRVGRWPKRLLIYRTAAPFAKLGGSGFEILGAGQQFVAFGVHPDTGRPYDWPLGDSPLDTPLEALTEVSEAACAELLAEVAALLPMPETRRGTARRAKASGARGGTGPVRDAEGRVIDGRDGWLSAIAFHAVHDTLDRGAPLDAAELSETVWQRFAGTTDLDRPRKDGGMRYGLAEARMKVADKLRLQREGRLPPRDTPAVEPDYAAPTLSVAEARAELDRVIGAACARFAEWHLGAGEAEAPRVGIRATVGLGKSVLARTYLLALRARLVAAGAPSRIVVLTPSHALADEAAGAWRAAGLRVAVLRGYEARDPLSREPMCRDIDAVHAAITAGTDIQSTACAGSGGRRCAVFDGCLKQGNRREVESADVVLAAYDALFTGFAADPASIGALLIDEGCWARAKRETEGVWTADFPSGPPRRSRRAMERDAETMADLLDLRGRATRAFGDSGPGPVRRAVLSRVGLTEADCLEAARLEDQGIRETGLYPGMPKPERQLALRVAEANERIRFRVAVWRAMARDLAAGRDGGRLRVTKIEDGAASLQVVRVSAIHHRLGGKPILHLDATLRPDLAATVLPGLSVTEIDAAAPFQATRLVTGSFGKSSLCPASRADPKENQRRANRLAECVDYVRWHARRVAPGRTLVITYLDIEAAFADIPGVEVAHFNAIAGLDAWRDAALLIVIGRPLPRDSDLEPMCGAHFGEVPTGGYHWVPRGIRLGDGSSRTVRVIAHEDEKAELLRGAICDDELIQAIGRGRGVNRTAADPLEVHLLADVAPPLVYDRLLAWDVERPDIVQRMLLEGIAVDSPADAAALHPALFSDEKQAEKAFERAGFKRQNPMSISYREMSLKSARYRRGGRGRSWQTAWWIEGSAGQARAVLTAAIGPLAAWQPA